MFPSVEQHDRQAVAEFRTWPGVAGGRSSIDVDGSQVETEFAGQPGQLCVHLDADWASFAGKQLYLVAGHGSSVAHGGYVVAMSSGSAVSITNLLYRYAELMDAGDLDAAAALFTHARIKADPEGAVILDSAGILQLWRGLVTIHADGTPRTKHVITNPILEIDEAAGTATCRSYYTVLQQTDAVALQVIAAGRYHDEFERIDDSWRFRFRDYSMFDLKGDLRDHLGVIGGTGG